MDGYVSNYQTVGGANQGGYTYFLTPNGYLYQTDGTEEGTKPLENFIPQNSMFLAATNNFVYYSTEAGSDLRFLQQFDPINLKRINSFKQGSSWDALKKIGRAHV